MKVGELIEILRQFPLDLEVFVVQWANDWEERLEQVDVTLRDVCGPANRAALGHGRDNDTRRAVVIA